jgi:hypothetical protein
MLSLESLFCRKALPVIFRSESYPLQIQVRRQGRQGILPAVIENKTSLEETAVRALLHKNSFYNIVCILSLARRAL